MGLDLSTGSVEGVIAALSESDNAFLELFRAVRSVNSWTDETQKKVDSIHRTLLRQLFAARQPGNALVAFSRHLNATGSVLRLKNPDLSAKLFCYANVVDDAIVEINGDWVERALSKEHVRDILHLLSRSSDGSVFIEDIERDIGIKAANTSRILAVMQSVGLISRSKVGRNVKVAVTQFGRVYVPPLATVSETASHEVVGNKITAVGFSELASFLDREGAPRAVVFDSQTKGLTLSERAFPAWAAVISEWKVIEFGVTSRRNLEEEYDVYVEVEKNGAKIARVLLGIWYGMDFFGELLHWIDRANMRGVLLNSESMSHRVVSRSKLLYVPGKSMSAAKPAKMCDYSPAWVASVAQSLCNMISNKLTRDRKITAERKEWGKHASWESIFNRIALPHMQSDKKQELHLCFDFLYLDPSRVGQYDIVRIGELNYWTMLYHAENERIDAVRKEVDGKRRDIKSEPPIWDYVAFKNAVTHVGLVGDSSAKSWEICGQISTVSNNIVQNLCDEGHIDDDSWHIVSNSNVALNKLAAKTDRLVVFCDNVIANEIRYLWEARHLSAKKLLAQHIRYPFPVPYGIGVPLGDDRWKAMVFKALEQGLNSTPDSKDAWAQTVEELRLIGASIDQRFDPGILCDADSASGVLTREASA